ncbi:hypothetical protein MKW98_016267 [Papaver atlanticum]|uniref:Uncharacterized protein n=1 Tax=Papaver atlanticum TaxID=357466 RepID=A0AAD4XFC6_9MAGN|nr:hypothetical protein MKW98_016267 [Papaver atlanticum]
MTNYTPINSPIPGVAGFVASHTANRLMRNYPDYRIVVFGKLDNLLVWSNSLLITESNDTIMHLAGQTYEPHQWNPYQKIHPRKPDEVYGETDKDAVEGTHEASQPLQPTHRQQLSCATNACAEMLVMKGKRKQCLHMLAIKLPSYWRSYGLHVLTTRGNNVYGPNQFLRKSILQLILLAMKGKPFAFMGMDPKAFEVVLHKGEIGHVYNIDGVKDVCQLIWVGLNELHGRKIWKTMDRYLKNPDSCGDVSGASLLHIRINGIYSSADSLIQKKKMVDPVQKTTNPLTSKPSLKLLIYDLAYEYGSRRLKERSTLVADILKVKSAHVFNAAGVTCRPTLTDWIADAEYPEGSGVGFKEEDAPNFSELLKEYDNVCTRRVHMPISSDLPCNFILEENLLSIKGSLVKYVFKPDKKTPAYILGNY